MNGSHPLRTLEELHDSLELQSGYTGTSRWMIPYADLMTLLLGFFLAFFAITQANTSTTNPAKAKPATAFSTSKLEEKSGPDTSDMASHLLKKTADEALAVSSPLSEDMKSLEETLLKELNLKGQQITVSQDSRGLVISFQERIFFAPGQATLSPKAQQTLDKLASVLLPTAHPIRVEGHTDNTPIKTSKFPSNWELSTSRATVIVRHLIEKHHFPPHRLSAGGYGEFAPLADNSTIEGKHKNRRVDIVLLNPIAGLSQPDSEATTQSTP